MASKNTTGTKTRKPRSGWVMRTKWRTRSQRKKFIFRTDVSDRDQLENPTLTSRVANLKFSGRLGPLHHQRTRVLTHALALVIIDSATCPFAGAWVHGCPERLIRQANVRQPTNSTPVVCDREKEWRFIHIESTCWHFFVRKWNGKKKTNKRIGGGSSHEPPPKIDPLVNSVEDHVG